MLFQLTFSHESKNQSKSNKKNESNKNSLHVHVDFHMMIARGDDPTNFET